MTRFDEVTDALALPRLVRLTDNLVAASFTLMKLVPARHILRTAAARGDIGPGTVVVETTSGTFGLALAMQTALMCRDLVLVSDPVVDAALRRRLVDLGARVEIVAEPDPVGGIQGARLRRLAEVREEYPDTFCPEQYSNPENPRSYAVVAEHLTRSLGQVDCVIGPVGSGGSMCGTVRALRESTPHTAAVGVDTHGSVLFGQPDRPRGLRGVGNSLVPANLDHAVFDEVHWCDAAAAYAATRALHRDHALFQGPTSGAAYLAARWWADRNPEAQCVVMLPDEGYRYQDTVFDDAWLSARELLEPMPAGPVDVDAPASAADGWNRFAWGRRTLADATEEDRVAVR
ncbi:pyridoxal-phosphate dependent enzyme [Saccharothrix longispora]|uniref:pyridoxal-phosphate dependent enzyme n=1 Tax=Saccharothrix longispora TaxID=33920 RepID=UPI0028FD66F2|nr:pyridoxal-phosphate dependent enzyme [Saccharothrix longispora]MDU0294211.1 pyridoxal-phosphate dependent enzyme [Saccharothrix longispora]